ncbi:hypothetical protein AA106556_0539 [Neokomagataea tanensis NBRC 106556]|uniref:Uncharacterized protein n=1 Tax=Neokomagataea tanensis NBRC 106556 TaxID=1223519 RepID=A0ABQ0QH97_9PROT|nr:hypothetical protein AA106556_0539 [Neokomagataea tanensis NBRC 106556]
MVRIIALFEAVAWNEALERRSPAWLVWEFWEGVMSIDTAFTDPKMDVRLCPSACGWTSATEVAVEGG